LVAVFFALDKGLGLVRDAVVSRAFGASAELDAYYAAFELPDGLFTILAGSALATSLIPLLSARIAESKGREDIGRRPRPTEGHPTGDVNEVWRLASAVFNLALALVVGVSIVAAVFAPRVIRVVAPGFDVYRTTLAVRLMRLVLLQTCLFIASAISISVLHAHQHFLLPAIAPLSYTLGRIGGALWLAPHWGIFGLAWGGMLGTVGHFLLQLPGLYHYRARWFPIWRHPDLPKLLALMGPRMLGMGITYLNFVLPTFLGSRLPPGAISAYEYGWRLMQFPETIIGTALGLTIYPTLAEFANAHDIAGLRRAGGWALRLMLALVIPASVGMILLGRPLIEILLQRGAFDARTTARVYWALQFLALGLIGHTALEVVARVFYAQRDMWTPLWATLAGLVVNLGIGWLLLPSLAHGAIALANSLGACLQVMILLIAARMRWGAGEDFALDNAMLLGSTWRTLGATAIMVVAIYGIQMLVPDFNLYIRTSLQLGGGMIAYLGGAVLFNVEELTDLPRLLFKRTPSPPLWRSRQIFKAGEKNDAPAVVEEGCDGL
jgi:putative peptidoglycan lipid II flippase